MSFFALGCPDPNGRYDDFVERFDNIDRPMATTSAGSGGASCTAPPAAGEADGEWILLLTVALSPTKPAPLRAQVSNTDTEFTMDLTPMNADDRTSDAGGSVGSFGPFPINADATFSADLGEIAAPGETNPLTDSALTVAPILAGTFCPGDFQCGDATGQIVAPLMTELTGTWTLIRASTFMEPPMIDCAGTTAAPL